MMADQVDLPATKEPVVGETRYIQLRTLVDASAGNSYDPRFALYEIELLPPGTDRDSAMESALVAADGDELVWLVVTGEVKFVATTEGSAKVRAESAVAAKGPTAK
jgi:hypothetical protein